MRTRICGVGAPFGQALFAAVLAVGTGLGAAACSFDSSVGSSGDECSDGEISEDGNRRCEDGTWVVIDSGGFDDADVAPDVADTGVLDDTSGSDAADSGLDTGTPGDADAADGDGFGDADGGCDAPSTWYLDDDDDGYGTSDQVKMACDQPQDYVADDGDCDDSDDSINPDASEDCDGVDNDCDGDTDEGCGCTYDPSETDDIDTDMSHDSGVCVNQSRDNSGVCQAPSEYESRTDTESDCTGVDNDCDGATDEGCDCIYDPSETDNADTDNSNDAGVCPGQTRDSNGVCQEPGDYDGADDESSAGLCDQIDNDCDGATDEGCDCVYDPDDTDNADSDGDNDDGVCTGQSRNSNGLCQQPGSFESSTDMEANCDGLDNDCDGATDEGCSCVYDPDDADNADSDGDNDDGVCRNQNRDSSGVCQQPSKFDDTDDEGSANNCDSVDNDCDGTVDEGCPCIYDPNEPDQTDTNGSHSSGVCTSQTTDSSGVCQQPGDFEPRSPSETSCDDGLDNDCDGETDEGWKSAGTTCSNDCECYSGNCDSGTCTHRIFVTAGEADGALGGLSGADTACQAAAQNAGLSGTWKAVLSDSSTDASSRITLSHHVDDMDGNRVADQSDFWSSNHNSAIDRDEGNNPINTCSACFDDHVWTGTQTDGTAQSNTCSDWTSNSGGISGDDGYAGDAGDSDSEWVEDWQNTDCSATRHLYCIDGQ